MKRLFQGSMTLFLTMGLISCGGGDVLTNGSISGTIKAGSTKPASLPGFVPGDVIIKFKSTGHGLIDYLIPGQPLPVTFVRELALPGVGLYHAPATPEQTLALVAQIGQRADVEYAQLNHIYYPSAVPSDPQYNQQWHYASMNLPAAWDISQGVATTVVSVIDDGMLYNLTDTDPKTHPDFAGKVIGGYDFISDPTAGADGDGRDANPYDPRMGLHGTHVGGTIAAATNNGKFGAGVNWNAKIINARALGEGGGSSADIIDAVLWSAGEPVQGVPANPNPAKVLNMSLGGDGACGQADQAAFDMVTAKGVIVVVAAGNENENVNKPKTPASCNNVITVGATGPTNKRAPYSNFGPRVDVMAPGGDETLSVNVGGADHSAGVYSTFLKKADGSFELGGIQGTSMATPHIAGLVSLMVGIDPTLNHAKTLAFLKSNSTALSAADCSNGNTAVAGTDCGAGLVDAAKTLKAVKDALGGATTPTPPAPPPPLAVKTSKEYVRAQHSSDANKSKQVEVSLNGRDVMYSIPDLVPGSYKVIAFTDLNGNAMVDATEPQVATDVTIGPGENRSGVNLSLPESQ